MSNFETYIAINTNEIIRKNSSSGGVFYSLAEYVLSKKGVVFGAAWNKNWLADIISVSSLKTLPKLMGSKYIQANIGKSFKKCKEYLDDGRIVLFSGIPCQLHGLKAYLKKDYDNLILVDIACHGLMPIQVWKDYLETIKRPNATITAINFRLKEPDWNNYAFEVEYSDGKILKEHHRKNKYMQAFLSDKYLKSSCYNCKFKNQFSCSDLLIGDAWGAQTNLDTKTGVSFIKVFTEKGKQLLSNLQNIKLVSAEYTKGNGCLLNQLLTKPEVYNKNIFKKKVGIITLHLIDNFGGTLQAYALNKLITAAGYDAETITWKDDRILPFAKNNIKLRIFNMSNDIKNIKETDYDILVVGSDQIWRKQFITGDFRQDYINIPFLQFTNNWNKTRISYAASIGVAENTWEYNKEDCEKIKQLLQAFNAVSVREIQSIKDCAEKFNMPVQQCLDPTMLLSKEDYLELCKNEPVTNKDLFVYILDETKEKINVISDYCAKNNLTYFKCSKSVESWLAAFRDAKYIITDSFHGCIFAILFNKPFICLYNKWRGNARFDSLVSLFNIDNIIYEINQLYYSSFKIADYSNFKQKQAESKQFLYNSIALPAKEMKITITQQIQSNKKLEEKSKQNRTTYLYF